MRLCAVLVTASKIKRINGSEKINLSKNISAKRLATLKTRKYRRKSKNYKYWQMSKHPKTK